MPLAKDSNDLKIKGYVFDNDAVCSRCGDDIEWWKSPKGSSVPINVMNNAGSPAIHHKETCTG